MKDKTKPPVETQTMSLALSLLDIYIHDIEKCGKKIEVITLTRFQSKAVRADLKRYNSPQKNHCGRITYPLGTPMYRGYALRLYSPPPNPKPEQASL